MSKRHIAVDLFSGAGGLSLGFEMAGFDVAIAVELSPIHCATYQLNFPNTAILCQSVVNTTGKEIRNRANLEDKDIDLVFGGSPCQGFSLIGKRNLNDTRNQLVFEFVRLVLELQPKYFVLENVKGITVGNSKKFLLEIIELFESNNYSIVDYQVLNAANYGVPQNRERLFLLGARKGLQLPNYPKPITRTPDEKKLELPTCPTVWDAIADLPEIENYPELLERDWVVAEYGKPSSYAAMLRGFITQKDDYSYPRSQNPRLLTNSLRTKHNLAIADRFKSTSQGAIEPISHFYKLDPDGICPTLRAGTDSSRGRHTAARPIHPFKPRVITVREAARLHSYPDWFRFHKTKLNGFQQVGNSVPPSLAKAVAAELLASCFSSSTF